MVVHSQIINANVAGTVSSDVVLTDETVITLYVLNETGTHHNSRMTIEYSPDGTHWVTDVHSTNGVGILTTTIAAERVRAKLVSVEGSEATSCIIIMAK